MNTSPLALLAAAFLVLCALTLIALGLWLDRSRGRRRCPRCWYAMDGAKPADSPALTCPECGRRIKNDRDLLRTRRRWWVVAASLPLLASATFIIARARIWALPWEHSIPTPALLALAKPEPPPAGISSKDPTARTLFNLSDLTFSARLTQEVWRRLHDNAIPQAPAERFLTRVLKDVSPSHWIWLPKRWAKGTPIPAWMSDPANPRLGLESVHPTSPDRRQTRESYTSGSSYRWEIPPDLIANNTIPIDLDYVVNDALSLTKRTYFKAPKLVDLPDLFTPRTGIDHHVAAALDPRLLDDASALTLRVDDRASSPDWSAITCVLGFSVEIRLNDTILARGGGGAEIDRPVMKDWREIPLEWTTDGPALARRHPTELSILFTSDWSRAEVELRANPLAEAGDKAWLGSVRVPLPFRAD